MVNDITPGFYGKLPSLGDFVSRRLPADFIKLWDQWIQEALYNSKETLGSYFRNCYQNSPIWRFVIGPDCCGENSVAGIMLPSSDKVGRHYPLIIAVTSKISLFHLMIRASQWFSQLEILAAMLLKRRVKVEAFDHQLQHLKLPIALFKNRDYMSDNIVSPANDPFFFRSEMNTLHQIPEALEYLTSHLLKSHLYAYSMWGSKDPQNNRSSLTVYRNLPPVDRFIQFLASPTNTSTRK